MKKPLLLLFTCGASMVFAQSQRLVFVEEFTQASCGPCAAANPAFNTLLAANTSKAVSVKYQTDWPGVDPMNAQNQADVANRVSYYGVSGVPDAFMDGNVASGSPGAVTQSGIDNEYAVASPFTITLNHWFNAANDSVFINCEVTCTQNVTMTSPHLRVAMIEKTITFTTAPGSNGEKDFYGVMRKMYPNGNGTNLAAAWTVGQKKTVSFAAKIPTYIYSKAQIATVAWVQDDNNKNVLQSGYCPTATAPLALAPVADFASDVITTCDGFVKFNDLSALFPNSWSWDFGDATTSSQKNPLHQYTASGTYTVKLTAANASGNNLVTKTSYVTVNLTGTAPGGVNDNICGSGIAYLSAAASGSGTLNWYDANGTMVHTGSTYSPNITGTTHFYVAEMTPNAVIATGAVDNTIGASAGGYFTANNVHGLYFDVAKNCTLNSVKCYANTAGSRTIEVFDNNGVSVQTATVNMTAGLNTVNLNFALGAGTGYLIRVTSTTVDLYRNSAGGAFPYTTNVITITGNTAAGNPAYYYFFYDWQVQQNDCASPAVTVSGIDSCSAAGIANVSVENSLVVFPNPNNGTFTTTFNTQQNDNYSVIVSNALGQVVYQEKLNNFTGTYTKGIDISSFGKGVYMLSIAGSKNKTIKKLITY